MERADRRRIVMDQIRSDFVQKQNQFDQIERDSQLARHRFKQRAYFIGQLQSRLLALYFTRCQFDQIANRYRE